METMEITFQPRPDLVRQQVERHRAWIEQQLGTSLELCLTIETDEDLTDIGTACILNCDAVLDISKATLRRLRERVTKAEIPEGMMPRVYLQSILAEDEEEEEDIFATYCEAATKPKNQERSVLSWQDMPIALHLQSLACPLIVMRGSMIDGPATTSNTIANLLLAPRTYASEVVALLDELTRPEQAPRLVTLRGETQKIEPSSWDQLVLDPKVSMLLKSDFEFFFHGADWFRRMNLPHRRGYLLHGPPGNGKTSAIRCMLSSYGLSAYTLRLFDPHTDDAELDRLFNKAVKKSPSVVLFEDLDRAYPRSGEPLTKISMQHFLNTLDGVATNKDIIVVATANEPTQLDPAILRRPGRFDRSVHFPNPSEPLRHQYYERLDVQWNDSQIEAVVRMSDGLSFAQLRESFILGGQSAFNEKRDVSGADVLFGVMSLRTSYQHSTRQQHAAGFKP